MFSSLSPLFTHFFSQYGLTVFYCFAYFIIIFVQVALCYFLYTYFFTFTLEDIQSAFDRLAFWRDHRHRPQVDNNAPNGNLNHDRPEDEQGLMDGDEDGDGNNDSDASSSTTTAELLDELSALTREDMDQYLRQAREQMLHN